MAGAFNSTVINAMLDAELGRTALTGPATVYVGFTSDIPSGPGTFTELTGNGYARTAVTNNTTNFPNASAGSKTTGVAIQSPTATGPWLAVKGYIIADASSGGTILAYGDMGGVPKAFTGTASTDELACTAHGFATDTPVRVATTAGGALPAPLAAATTYYALNISANVLKLQATAGGGAINLTTDGQGEVMLWSEKTNGTNDRLELAIGALVMSIV